MRLVSLCLLIVYVSFLPSAEPQSPGPNEKKTKTDSNQNKAGDKKKATQQSLPPSVSVTQIAPVTIANWPQQERKNPWWDAVVSNWPLIVVGVLGTVAALLTLGVIRRQTDALINAERAWLLIHSNFKPISANKFDWNITNSGRTTATIDETNVRCLTMRTMQELPDTPEYHDPINVRKAPIAPGQTLWFWSYFETQGDNPTGFSEEDSAAVDAGRVELVFYGYVKYTDSFGKPHESRFCYYYVPWCGEFRINLRAPAEFHRCT